MKGVDRDTGKRLVGLSHLRQSVRDILTTPIGSRVMRRDYGSRLYTLVDHPVSDETVMEVYMATAEALLRWEPRLDLTRVHASVSPGKITISLEGRYIPDGKEIRMEGIEVVQMIDLSRLPAPNIVEAIDYEAILEEMLADLRLRDSEFDALVESDPAYKILEVAAYREVILRQRVNDAARAVMLAYARGADLDQVGAGVDVLRIDGESDDRYRSRVQMSWERLSTAGPAKSYRYWGLSVGKAVKDIGVYSPAPGCVRVVVLGSYGDGVPSADLLAKVHEAVSSDERRPLTDTVETVAAQVVKYNVTASLELYPGVAAEPVIEEAQAKVRAVVDDLHLIDEDIMSSRIISALHVEGVKSVDLVIPSEDLLIDCSQAGYCSGISLAWRVADRR